MSSAEFIIVNARNLAEEFRRSNLLSECKEGDIAQCPFRKEITTFKVSMRNLVKTFFFAEPIYESLNGGK